MIPSRSSNFISTALISTIRRLTTERLEPGVGEIEQVEVDSLSGHALRQVSEYSGKGGRCREFYHGKRSRIRSPPLVQPAWLHPARRKQRPGSRLCVILRGFT